MGGLDRLDGLDALDVAPTTLATAAAGPLAAVLTLLGRNAAAAACLAGFLGMLIGVGAVFPGATVVALAGFAARRGEDASGAAVAAVAAGTWLGVMAGGLVDYALGRALGRRLVPRRAPLRLAARWRLALRAVHRFMARWGSWAIVVGALTGPGRGALALAAGASGWAFPAFLAGQAVAALVWTALFVGIGFFGLGAGAARPLP